MHMVDPDCRNDGSIRSQYTSDIRLTATTVEAFHKGERVAAHTRSYVRGGHTTLKEHMPPEHRRYAEWSPSRFIQWAGKTTAATAQLVERIITTRWSCPSLLDTFMLGL